MNNTRSLVQIRKAYDRGQRITRDEFLLLSVDDAVCACVENFCYDECRDTKVVDDVTLEGFINACYWEITNGIQTKYGYLINNPVMRFYGKDRIMALLVPEVLKEIEKLKGEGYNFPLIKEESR